MPNDLTIFNDMLQKEAQITPKDNKHRSELELTEEIKGKVKYGVNITDMPKSYVVIKIDKHFPEISILFNEKNGQRKRADYAIIAEQEDRKQCIIIELKEKTGNKEHIVNQLKGAACLLRFCKAHGQMFWNKPNFLNDYQFRYVVFENLASHSKPLFDKSDFPDTSPNHSPETVRRFNSTVVSFNSLGD